MVQFLVPVLVPVRISNQCSPAQHPARPERDL